MASSSSIPPASRPLQWAALLLVPVLSWTVGIAFLPRPLGVDMERKTTDRADLAEVVSKKKPVLETPADAVLDGKLRFIGAKLPAKAVSQASRALLSFHFEVLADIDRDWQMFVHMDRRDGPYRIHGDHMATDGKYPMTLWEKGDFVVDHFRKLIPIDAPAGTYDIWLGFYIGDARMKFTGGDKSLHDGGNRIRAGTLQVQ